MNGTQAADSTQPADGAAAATTTSADAGTSGSTGRAESGSGSGSTSEGAEATRERIDELDARLIALVRERKSVSERAQQARIDAGGRRVHLAGEMRVLDHYRRELGRSGTQLAMTLLGFCRGQL
jgi:chorismate mutase